MDKQELKDFIEEHDEKAKAYIELVGEEYAVESFDEAYQGQYDSDSEFAQDLCEQLGEVISDQWPHSCIDWEHAAHELMYDYMEQDGYYFRSL